MRCWPSSRMAAGSSPSSPARQGRPRQGKAYSLRQGGRGGERRATFRRQCQAASRLCASPELHVLAFPRCSVAALLLRSHSPSGFSVEIGLSGYLPLGALWSKRSRGRGDSFDCGGLRKVTGVQSRHRTSCAEGSWRRGGAAAFACLAMGAIFCAHPVAAETLQEALSNAYLINPVLNSERARLRATDEQVAVAKSGLRPNISASGDAGLPEPGIRHCRRQPQPTCRNAMRPRGRPSRPSAPRSMRRRRISAPTAISPATASPIRAAIRCSSASPSSRASRISTPSARPRRRCRPAARVFARVEQTTLLNAVTAYVDVVRDQAVVRLRQTQRRGADRAAPPDQGPLQCRRGDAHRRGPGRGAPVGRHHPALCGASQPQDEPRHLRADHRPSAVEPRPSALDRASAAEPARRRHDAWRRARTPSSSTPSIRRRPRSIT